MKEYLDRQIEIRQQAWHQAKAIIDVATAEKRDLSAEEEQTYSRLNNELNERAATIAKLREDESRELRMDAATREIADQVRPVASAPVQEDVAMIRALIKGESRSANFERRDVLKSSTGSPVPTSFYNQVIMKARLVAPVLATSTVLNTAGGENLQIPRLSTYSVGTVNAEAAAMGESDPAFSAFITLGAFKYGFLTQVSQELLEDSGVDMLSFLADQVGNALGFAVGSALTVGTGTVEPTGIVAASSVGGTSGTATGFTADNLIDLLYSLDGAARNLPGVGWMMTGQSVGRVRKLKDTAGNYVFQPSLAMDSPDMLLGKPIYENPSMAEATTGTKSVIVGHLPSYYVRSVGGLKLDRSDDYAFNQGLATFRATFRVDGNLPQTSHVKHLLQP
ncbi:COG4653 Predicted phage phi-C31 gp36 major capsid-like protein [uncultured Caudovirales phage]|uniref:COG4653 Predicted phage phi-C31 gp36 major capsid-like protein n=1 Tax=uncultured Caudovirales phage TaxID=2100421 RepID=A0A6J5PP71_9CAUD|nr:COG4653 Predicted phage phi-C31 gp36 major capsid-like protein [uncultured Caudovirales phage]CAB4184210.1 COG4653 Predicted phage phi-C31 gp36 major capsid-like protein [uncultured Caudovirales phage]CAB4203382.1 COG4653 Predicted phage phi-C31 gp36 major capsid-like protein [uncultured Caudovirales phage]